MIDNVTKADIIIKILDLLICNTNYVNQKEIMTKLDIDLKTLIRKINTLTINNFEIEKNGECYIFKGKKGYSNEDIKAIMNKAYTNGSIFPDTSFLLGFKDLKSLNLKNNLINDISFLKENKILNILRLDCINVEDFSYLEELKEIKYLEIKNAISYKRFVDFSKLENLYHLKIKNVFCKSDIDLKKTKIKFLDFECVRGNLKITIPQNLHYISLINTEIVSVDFLKDCIVVDIRLLNNKNLNDYSILYTVKNLKFLTIDTQISKLIDIEKIKINNPYVNVRIIDLNK